MKKTWLVVRLALVVASFLQGLFLDLPLAPSEGMSGIELLLIFCFGIVAMIIVVGIQRLNPRSVPTWRYPSWYINPFIFREPLQFFHVGAFTMLALAAGGGLRVLASDQPLQLSLLVPLVFGVSILVGVYACTWVFRGKMAAPNKTMEPTR